MPQILSISLHFYQSELCPVTLFQESIRYLQHRRNFFVYFRRTEAKARRPRRGGHARGKGSGGEFGLEEERTWARVLGRNSLNNSMRMGLFFRPLCLSDDSCIARALLSPQFAQNAKNRPFATVGHVKCFSRTFTLIFARITVTK